MLYMPSLSIRLHSATIAASLAEIFRVEGNICVESEVLRDGSQFQRLRNNSALHLILGGAAPGSPARPVLARWGGAVYRCANWLILMDGFSR